MTAERFTRSEWLHQQAAELREKARLHKGSFPNGATIAEIAQVSDEARAMRRAAGILLRRARAAAKREGRA